MIDRRSVPLCINFVFARFTEFIQYVRDCLEVLRVGAGLDNGRRVRRGDLDEWKYIYVEEEWGVENQEKGNEIRVPTNALGLKPDSGKWMGDAGLRKKR